MYIIRRALNIDLFNSDEFVFPEEKNDFPFLSFKKTYVHDNISQSLSVASISSSSCNSTPHSKLFDVDNNYQDSKQLKSLDVISAIELRILSSENDKVEIETVKNFLEASKLELMK
uniref:Uncharacterized protein n=1 Tax=Strongyloides venezuelensis TaxID=75913 RepID=A0A0K0F298_STRVS